ncbi:MAG: extracellular solute-binding protein [Lachnospiraceae bacterium]|nr:extracellular solute-binding protein [Lachnospiraceae bacterium]
MRKTWKKLLALGLVATMVAGMTACGGKKAAELDKLTILVDNTVVNTLNGQAQFEAGLEELMGIDIEIIQPDHSGYYDTVGQTFANPDTTQWPDIVLLGSTYYATYASQGLLADLTEIWEKSDLKASGVIADEKTITDYAIDGKIYGIAPARGNGCMTYVKQSWLDKAGITKVPTTYAEYTAMLDAFVALSPDGYAITSPGLVNNEAPYVNYLPEFFQSAYPDFYQKEDGTWVDGFSEQAMKDALGRLIDAYNNGWIDKEFATNKTSTCRDKFYADKCGVFTYWAGTWAATLSDKLIAAGLDSELVAMKPIDEVGQYIERYSPVWAITSACENPEQAFDLFFGTMLDGSKGQVLWTFGAEDVHWSKKAEDVVVGSGDSTKTYTYGEGEFHFKANLETGDSQYKKNHIDPVLSIAKFKDGEDVSNAQMDPRASAAADIFFSNCTIAPKIVSNDTMSKYQSAIMSLRIELVSQVAAGTISIEDAYARYNDEQGANIQAILDSLNNK